MYYIVETMKPFDRTAADLDTAVKNNGFGVLGVHDLGNTLRSKGMHFEEQCKVFEVCNPVQASRVLAADMKLNMVLPCRISVYTVKGKTHIGFIKPVHMLLSLSNDPALVQIATEVEEKMIHMVNGAR